MKLTIIAGGGINASTVSLNPDRGFRKPQGQGRRQQHEDGWTERPNRNNRNNKPQHADGKSSNNTNTNHNTATNSNNQDVNKNNAKSNNPSPKTNDTTAKNNNNNNTKCATAENSSLQNEKKIDEKEPQPVAAKSVPIENGIESVIAEDSKVAEVNKVDQPSEPVIEIVAEPAAVDVKLQPVEHAAPPTTSETVTVLSPSSTPQKERTKSESKEPLRDANEKASQSTPTSVPLQSYSFELEAFGPFSGMCAFVEIDGALYLRLDPSHESTKSISEKIENIKHPKIEKSIIDLEPELMERVAVIEKMRQETKKPQKKIIPQNPQTASPTSFAQMQVVKQKSPK